MIALITGATGLIGSRYLELYGSEFSKIYQLGRSRTVSDAEWIKYDFSSGRAIDLPHVDVLFHFAGQTSVYKAKEDVLFDLNTNIVGFVQLLESFRRRRSTPFVVFAGTATEVGFTAFQDPVDETVRDKPITFYDVSKLAAENYLFQYIYEGWAKGCSLRLCNVYGGVVSGQHVERGVIDKVFQKSLTGLSITMYGDGEWLRDYIHIDDVVSAFHAAWNCREAVSGDYYYIGTGKGVTLRDAFSCVVGLVKEATGKAVDIQSVAPPNGLSEIEFRSFVADASKFEGLTGWKAKYDLENGLRYSYKELFDCALNYIEI